MNDTFDLKILATNWGFKGTIEELCRKVKQEGYDGIEIPWLLKPPEQAVLFAALKQYQLEVGFLCLGFDSDYHKHFEQFRKAIDEVAMLRPLYINCHSGRDYFSYEQNKTFIDHTTRVSRETGIPICHETHRARILYSAPVARHYLDTIPELRLTLDASHWCNVSESLLEDQQETIDLAISRTDHIHARVGHPEGPQVSDPRAPEWTAAMDAHLAWWDKIVDAHKKARKTLTILTEFGPPDYMPVQPYTKEPLADQWAINVYMMRLLRERYL